MNANIIYPSLLIIAGILVSTVVIIFLTKVSKRFIRLFQLYPESRGILNISLKLITWFVGSVIFLVFLRWAFRIWGLQFTTSLVEDVINTLPRYIVAVFIILAGFYISRIAKERAKEYDFEYKSIGLFLMDFIIHMTFIFTALYSIGVNITFFMEFYRVILWTVGAILALIISMAIGIPVGISIYDKRKKL